MLGFGPVVRVVNRVVGADGTKVPQRFVVGGEDLIIRDTLDLPWGIAKIVLQQSMYFFDPMSGEYRYKLGCRTIDPAFPMDVEESPLSESEIGDELCRHQPGWTRIVLNNRARRHDPLRVGTPGTNEDGAYQGTFGDLPQPA